VLKNKKKKIEIDVNKIHFLFGIIKKLSIFAPPKTEIQ